MKFIPRAAHFTRLLTRFVMVFYIVEVRGLQEGFLITIMKGDDNY